MLYGILTAIFPKPDQPSRFSIGIAAWRSVSTHHLIPRRDLVSKSYIKILRGLSRKRWLILDPKGNARGGRLSLVVVDIRSVIGKFDAKRLIIVSLPRLRTLKFLLY
jgi:hypothetical protein